MCWSSVKEKFSFSEIPLPNEQARMEILKIHAAPIAKNGEIGMEIIYSFVVLQTRYH